MSDKFHPIAAARLADWIFRELESRDAILGLDRNLFWEPRKAPFSMNRYGRRLETPLGVAAGPHTQLAQNIVAAWLMGARFIELKTVQTLDELEISKPCIDAEDATYNCEWSQELRLSESLQEYVTAWVLIHALRERLGWGTEVADPGFIFNMSVGYNLEGIQQPNVQAFLDQMADASSVLPEVVEAVAAYHPSVRDLSIPATLSDNVTLSTMHGCPPDEIERIGQYLIDERGLHTSIKLNPTLLGPERLRTILNQQLGFREITVPDEAFEHDLKYPDAVAMIRALAQAAQKRGVFFGLKLTNTLEVANHRRVFQGESMMYMSGRALHPLTMTLAAALLEELNAEIPISISGGVDAFNLPRVLACGLAPVTVCTDLLRPGGYGRLPQYLEELESALSAAGAGSLEEWVSLSATGENQPRGAASVKNSKRWAEEVLSFPHHHARRHRVQTKADTQLDWFDCVEPPCRAACPAGQNIPHYLHLVASGRTDEALRVIRDTNPLPRITGAVCDHPCVSRCVRNHYDEPLAIRQIKRFAACHGKVDEAPPVKPAHDGKVAVIGAGPAGLTAAYRLAREGYQVTVFEAREGPGGMVAWAIPAFRLTEEDIRADLDRIASVGVEIRYGQAVGQEVDFASLRGADYDAVVVAVGAQAGQRMGIEGEDCEGVMDGLTFLQAVRRGQAPTLGAHTVVIGGGNAAMDAARTAWRLAGTGRVTVLYRRTRREMPADPDEVDAVEAEGVAVEELVMPVRVTSTGGKLTGLTCVRMALSERDASGRPRPVPVEGSEFEVDCSTMLMCVSQRAVLDCVEGAGLSLTRFNTIETDPQTLETSVSGVFAAGDVVRGPATVIQAVSDGHRAAEAILRRDGRWTPAMKLGAEVTVSEQELRSRRVRRQARVALPERGVEERRDFEEVTPVIPEALARSEAARCLLCSEMCSLCVTVCPNRANQAYCITPRAVQLSQLRVSKGKIEHEGQRELCFDQRIQIVNITNFCNECGNCQTFCPTAGAPYRDKPRLHLGRESYAAETDRALYINSEGTGWRLRVKIAGVEHQVVSSDWQLRYTSPAVEAVFDRSSFGLLQVQLGADPGPEAAIDLAPAVRMAVLLEGLVTSLPHLFE